VLVVFFALAGAGLALRTLSGVWWLVIPVVLIRALGIWAGCRIGVRWAGIPPKAGDNIWMGLVAQAGVAIGLAAVVTEVYPERGAPLQALFLGVLAVNQLLGPILFLRALASSGEIPNGDGDIESEEAEDSIEEQPATATAG
jgi:Kef-type K+ transport system membrane component KefB